MSSHARPLVLDATSLVEPEGDRADRVAARALMADPSPLAALLRIGRRGVEALGAGDRTAETPFDAVRRWLLGQGPRLVPPGPAPRPTLAEPFRPRRRGRPVLQDALVLKPGLRGWSDPAWRAFLRDRPDVGAVALLDVPVAWGWPEYAGADDLAAMPADLAALAATARSVLVPDEAARLAFGDHLARSGVRQPPLLVASPPSLLAGGSGLDHDAALAAIPYFVLVDPIEARANTAFILQLWRAMIAEGGPVPRLVLAGERGRQVQEIKPLLDWNATIAALVLEAPRLAPPALRALVAHARAVLAPAFAGTSGALLRDVRLIGTPLIASDPRAGGVVLDPIDGRGWREAIAAAICAEPPAGRSAVSPDRDAAMGRIVSLATAP